MKVRRRTALIFVILFLLLYSYSFQSTEVTDQSAYSNQPTQAIPSQAALELFTVTEVIDGDTIRTSSGKEELTIRLIGIDTPETKDPNTPIQCFGEEAGNHLQELLADETFYLEPDLTQADKDRYGRLLRYLILEDGTNINLEMIRDGYAYEYTYQVPYKYQLEFKQAEKQARDQSIGLWSNTTCAGQR